MELGFSIEIKALPGFVLRRGYALQPNVAARRLRWVQADKRGHNPIGVEANGKIETQGSRGGNPGLKVATASR